jgi:hypothetical protein
VLESPKSPEKEFASSSITNKRKSAQNKKQKEKRN